MGSVMQDDDDKGETRRGIQSVEVGFALLLALSQSRGMMPLKLLAEKAGMSPSKAHLYLVSYIRVGLVVQDPATSRYGLGSAAVQLGMAALNQLDLVDIARAQMSILQERTGTFVSLSVWGNRGATIVGKLDGDVPSPMSVQLGHVLPLLSTATSRVFMAHLPRSAWRQLAEMEEAHCPGRLNTVLDDLDLVRERGYAQTYNLNETGFFGVSAPIFDGMGSLRGVMTVLGVSTENNLARLDAFATEVMAAAGATSQALGRYAVGVSHE